MSQYQHSQAFATLKRTKEAIGSNATTPQYLLTLDNLLLNAVRSLLLTTDAVETMVANLLGWQEQHRRRKVSFLDPSKFRQLAVVWLCTPSKPEKLATFSRLCLDRGTLFDLCSRFLDDTVRYVSVCDGRTELSYTEALAYKHQIEAQYRSNSALLPCCRDARLWYVRALAFRDAILQKFTRLCITTAQTEYTTVFGCRVPLDDLVQTYLLAATRAIDKCDPNQGVLTSHIQYWLLTARNAMDRVAPREEEPTSDVLDAEADQQAISIEDHAVSADSVNQLLAVARLLDEEGYGRAFLGLYSL